MGAVSSTGREALDEMRRLLGVLREHADTPLAPQPGLDQLDALVEQVRGAGLRDAADAHRGRRRRSARARSSPSTGSCRRR